VTIKEAMAKGISELRLPEWNPQAKLSLQRTPDGKHFTPWARLHDYGTPEEGMSYCVIPDTDDRWEEAKDWKPMSPADAEQARKVMDFGNKGT
jgi:hypothetical protein